MLKIIKYEIIIDYELKKKLEIICNLIILPLLFITDVLKKLIKII